MWCCWVVAHLHNVIKDVSIACSLEVEVVVVDDVQGRGLVCCGSHGNPQVHGISWDAVHHFSLDSTRKP